MLFNNFLCSIRSILHKIESIPTEIILQIFILVAQIKYVAKHQIFIEN